MLEVTTPPIRPLYLDAVVNYGATGDGTTDNRLALQAALNALVPGGELFIPTGTYLVSHTGFLCLLLTQASNWRIRGAGRGRTIIRMQGFTSAAQSTTMLKLDRCANGVIEGITLDGNWGNVATTVTNASHGVTLSSASTISVLSTAGFPASGTAHVLTDQGAQAFTYTGMTSTSFTGVTSSGAGRLVRDYGLGYLNLGHGSGSGINFADQPDPQNYGIFNRGCQGLTIRDCEFINHYGDALWCGNSDTDQTMFARDIHVSNCTVNMSARNGFTLAGAAIDGALIEHVKMTNISSQAIDSEPVYAPARNVTIRDCYLGAWWDPNTQGAAPLSIVGGAGSGDSSAARNWRVHDNTICGTTYIERAKDVIFSNNRILQDFSDGTYSSAAVVVEIGNDDVTIRDNYFYCRSSNAGSINTQIASGSNGASLASAGTIFVVSTAGYPSSGTFSVNLGGNLYNVAYTGISGNSFTGCTTGGTGTLATGQWIYQIPPSAGVGAAILILNYVAGSPLQQYTPANIRVLDNKIDIRNGRNGIQVVSSGGQTAYDWAGGSAAPITGVATAINTAATAITVASNGAALPQSTINVGSTAGFASSGLVQIKTTSGFQVVSYTGVTGTSLTGCSGGTGTMHTTYDVLQTMLTDSGQSWTTNAFIGLRVKVSGKHATVVSNNATQLLMWAPDPSMTAGSWVDFLGNYASSVSGGAYEIYRPTGICDIAGNTIDCTDDGNGPGVNGIYATASSSGLPGMRLKVRGNTVKNSNGPGIWVKWNSGANSYNLLEVTDNHARDDQAVVTTTACVHYEGTPNISMPSAWVMRGNTVGARVAATVTGATSSYWLTSDGMTQDWAGYGDPSGVVMAPAGSTYRRVDGGAGATLYVNETGGTGWAAMGSTAPQAPTFVKELGLAGANMDIALTSNAGAAITSGQLQLIKVRCFNATFSKVVLDVTNTASGATAVYVGVYKADGTQNSDMSTATIDAKATLQGGVGTRTVTLTNSVSVTPGDELYIGILAVGATTGPAFRSGANGTGNGNLTSAMGLRCCATGAGLTSLPSSFTLTAVSGAGNLKFVGIS